MRSVRAGGCVGFSEGGALSVLYAAMHPHRVERLIVFGSFAVPPGMDKMLDKPIHPTLLDEPVTQKTKPNLYILLGEWTICTNDAAFETDGGWENAHAAQGI